MAEVFNPAIFFVLIQHAFFCFTAIRMLYYVTGRQKKAFTPFLGASVEISRGRCPGKGHFSPFKV
jgi:hypothetical protein